MWRKVGIEERTEGTMEAAPEQREEVGVRERLDGSEFQLE